MRKKYAKLKEVNRLPSRTNIITEYRQPGGDSDGDSIVRMRWGLWCYWGGDGYKIFYRVILY